MLPGVYKPATSTRRRVERRLAAIMGLDIVSYSILMANDEEETHRRVGAELERLGREIERSHGRVFSYAGDGIMAEFPSAVESLKCSLRIQSDSSKRNTRVSADKQIVFRIGLNSGEIVLRQGRIGGNAVNLAARLEGIAEPGGIALSEPVYEQVRRVVSVTCAYWGEHRLKNIREPVRVYMVPSAECAAWTVMPTRPPGTHTITAGPATEYRASLAGVGQQSRGSPRLAIAVLPFRNIHGDTQGDHFAEGLTENVTTDLARVWDMLVIAHRSASMYDGRKVSASQIGRELGVRYILEGSVQRSGDELLVNARLVDVESDKNIWTERHRGNLSDPFLLQDVITNRVISALTVNIIAREAAWPVNCPDAFEHTLMGRAALSGPISAQNYDQAIAAFEKALTVDPQFVQAKIFLALSLANRLLDLLSKTPDTDVERAEVLVEEARLAAPRSVLLHFAKAQLLRATARCDEAIIEYETVLMLDRNWPTALAAIGRCKLYTGPLDDVITLEEQAIRLSPMDRSIGFWYSWIGLAHLLQGRADEALVWFRKGISVAPGLGFIHLYLAAAYGAKEELQAAREQLARVPRASSLSIAMMRGDIARNVKSSDIMAAYESTLIAGWRKAGLSEE